MNVKLLTRELTEELLANGRRAATEDRFDPLPVAKLFTPDAGATWLLAWIDPDEPSLAFGLCDLGLGFPELGWVSLEELAEVRGPFGLAVERDRHFKAIRTLSDYAERARERARIVA